MPPNPKKTKGRPKLADGKSKASRIFCRLSASEALEIKTAAEAAMKERSAWIRDVLLAAARKS